MSELGPATALGPSSASGYQPSDSDLTSIAALGTAADKGLYTTGAHTWSEFDLTSAGRAILDDANAGAQRTTLGLGNVENTALSTWAGTSNITTLGTIGTGVWNGTVIGPTYLGSGAPDATYVLRGDGAWKVRPMVVPLVTSTNTAITLTAPAVAATEVNATTSNGFATTLDLSGFTQYRIVVKFGTTGAAGVKFMLRGSVGGSGVHNLEDTTDASNTAAATYSSGAEVVGAWTNLHATYKSDGVLVTIYTVSGDASTNLIYRRIEAQFR